MIPTAILALFSGAFGKLWSGFCTFINTPIGAALVAAFIFFWVGVYHEHGNLVEAVKAKDIEWQTKVDEAEKQAELDRQKRDALIKAKMDADAQARLDAVSARKNELEQMVKDYEDKEKQGPIAPSDLTDDSDARWLRDAKRATNAKSKARSGITGLLRGTSR